MEKATQRREYFTKAEICIWTLTVIFIVVSFLIFDRKNWLNLAVSLIGATALILCAKGNPIGQVLIIIFSLIYGYISLSCRYYGEMLTYVCMTMPMAVFSLISWLKNPYKGNKSEVAVSRINRRDIMQMAAITVLVSAVFYFVLRAFCTANIILSTLSVTTSFSAVYLTYKRSPFYAVAYALNDIVLILLWSLATIRDISYLSVIICFIAFLANDIYGFINWQRMFKRQSAGE